MAKDNNGNKTPTKKTNTVKPSIKSKTPDSIVSKINPGKLKDDNDYKSNDEDSVAADVALSKSNITVRENSKFKNSTGSLSNTSSSDNDDSNDVNTMDLVEIERNELKRKLNAIRFINDMSQSEIFALKKRVKADIFPKTKFLNNNVILNKAMVLLGKLCGIKDKDYEGWRIQSLHVVRDAISTKRNTITQQFKKVFKGKLFF